MNDAALPIEQRILARAAVAANEAGFVADAIGDAVLSTVRDRLAYVGVLIVEALGMDTHGTDPPESGSLPGDERAAMQEIVHEQALALEREAARLSLARVVVACAERMLERVCMQRRGGADGPSSSDVEMLSAALDAFTSLDESLPRADV